MTDDKQDPSVVAWVWRMRVRLNSVSDWGSWSEWGIGKHNCTDTDYAQYEEQQVSLTSGLTAMKAELEEAKKATERMWCLSCGTVTRDGQCDCTRLDMDCQNLVNYADALAGDREAAAKEINAILARAEAAEQERDELREALSLNPRWCLEMGYDRGDEEGDYGWIVFEVSGNVNDREWEQVGFGDTPLAALKSARAALSKPKPHDETRGRE